MLEPPERVGTKENVETERAREQEIQGIIEKIGLRSWLLDTPEIVGQMVSRNMARRLSNVTSLLMYAIENPARKRRTPMDVSEVVARWRQVITAYCTAHSKEDFDQADYQMDELFGPLLTAPVKQLREFYPALVAALKDDPSVPMIVWETFEIWGKTILDKAKDEEVIQLKADLAREIAQMVEQEVQPGIMEAIAGALKWRSPEQLGEIKTALEAGAKPKLVGRQSCLYLCVGEGESEVKVML